MTGISIILIFLAIIWFWLDSARSREIAIAICKTTSERYGLQFLDDTVVLQRIGIRWPTEGLRLRRLYRFDFSRQGTERHTGYIILVGIRLENLDFGINLVEINDSNKHSVNDVIPISKNTDR